jgi:hypothetical protein
MTVSTQTLAPGIPAIPGTGAYAQPVPDSDTYWPWAQPSRTSSPPPSDPRHPYSPGVVAQMMHRATSDEPPRIL